MTLPLQDVASSSLRPTNIAIEETLSSVSVLSLIERNVYFSAKQITSRMRTKRGADGQARSNSDTNDDSPASMPSTKETLDKYKTASQVFGGNNKSNTLSIAEATRKLANDLNEFESKHCEKQAAAAYNDVSNEMVETLQLQSCRKLRQVRLFIDCLVWSNPARAPLSCLSCKTLFSHSYPSYYHILLLSYFLITRNYFIQRKNVIGSPYCWHG